MTTETGCTALLPLIAMSGESKFIVLEEHSDWRHMDSHRRLVSLRFTFDQPGDLRKSAVQPTPTLPTSRKNARNKGRTFAKL